MFKLAPGTWLQKIKSQNFRQALARTSTQTALVVALVMIVLTVFVAAQLRAAWHRHQESHLLRQVERLAQSPAFANYLIAGAGPITDVEAPPRGEPVAAELAAGLTQATALLGGPLVITDSDGVIQASHPRAPGDSTGIEAIGVDLSRTPEIRAALNTGTGIHLRPAGNADRLTYFAAAAIPAPDAPDAPNPETAPAPLGSVRVAVDYTPYAAALRPLQSLVLVAALGVTLLLAGIAVVLAERDTAEIRRLTTFAHNLAAGRNEQTHLLSIRRPELTDLTRSLNRLADRLKSQAKKRARERDRLVTIMHVMTDGVIILNKSGRVRLLNPAAERILRTTQSRAVGRSFVQTARDHRIAEVWERCLASGEDESAAVDLGASQFVRVAVTPFLKRTARGYLVILQDLTEVRRLQTVRQDFVSNVSHELRTPLASLRALVDTLRDGAIDDPPAAHRFLDRMEVEVDALTQMVAELLELSRIESGQVPLQLSVVAPDQVLGIGAERLRPQTERANITLVVEIPEDLPSIAVDSTRIQQVVTNLVHNAIKFTPPGGKICMTATVESRSVSVPPTPSTPPPRALPVAYGDTRYGDMRYNSTRYGLPATRVSELPASITPNTGKDESLDDGAQTLPVQTVTSVVVKVQDTGTGIPQNELPRIFERFYKTDRSRALGGTGLGLAISKHIVQLHNGSIWAESDGKSGSAFYFALPVVTYATDATDATDVIDATAPALAED